ncbi:MAG: fibronectin type III domain-containing protein [Chloroflexi bacterium]|nr:fibronectin type III domain-containing protein [Chloroflexota bacterium]
MGDSLSGVTKYDIVGYDGNITGTWYNVTEPECGTDYTFRVSAYSDGTTYKAKWVAWASTTTTTAGCPLPPAHENFTVGTVTTNSVPPSWDAVSGAAKYRVEYRLGTTGDWTETKADITGAGHTVDGLNCATAFGFRARVYGDGMTLDYLQKTRGCDGRQRSSGASRPAASSQWSKAAKRSWKYGVAAGGRGWRGSGTGRAGSPRGGRLRRMGRRGSSPGRQ